VSCRARWVLLHCTPPRVRFTHGGTMPPWLCTDAIQDHSARHTIVPPGANPHSLPSLAKPGSGPPAPGAEMAPESIRSAWCWCCPAAACCHRLVLRTRLGVPGQGGWHRQRGSGRVRMARGRHECLKPQYRCLKTLQISTGSESTAALVSSKW